MHRNLRYAVGLLVLAGALSAGAGAAQAQPGGVNGRQQHQRERIAAGVQDGSLTRLEAHRLAAQESRTRRIERNMRADGGGLGPAERLRLDQRLDRTSARIRHARHDAQSN